MKWNLFIYFKFSISPDVVVVVGIVAIVTVVAVVPIVAIANWLRGCHGDGWSYGCNWSLWSHWRHWCFWGYWTMLDLWHSAATMSLDDPSLWAFVYVDALAGLLVSDGRVDAVASWVAAGLLGVRLGARVGACSLASHEATVNGVAERANWTLLDAWKKTNLVYISTT